MALGTPEVHQRTTPAIWSTAGLLGPHTTSRQARPGDPGVGTKGDPMPPATRDPGMGELEVYGCYPWATRDNTAGHGNEPGPVGGTWWPGATRVDFGSLARHLGTRLVDRGISSVDLGRGRLWALWALQALWGSLGSPGSPGALWALQALQGLQGLSRGSPGAPGALQGLSRGSRGSLGLSPI